MQDATFAPGLRPIDQEVGEMSNAAERLELCEAILALIERKRAQTGDATLGLAIERLILDTQFQEIECDILADPGAFEPWLTRRRVN
jgi:hypothetical protein